MNKGRKYIFLPLFFFFLISFISAKDLIFKGFVLQNPHQLLKRAKAELSSQQIKKLFDQTGFFRSVTFIENQHSITFSVVEYPLLERVSFRGNTLHDKKELLEYLGLKTGVSFNSRDFNECLTAFYGVCKTKGYTHWQLTGIEMRENGQLIIDIDEGILQGVEVADDLIETRIVHRFFSHLLNKPFNSREVKLVLEEMLFTESFYVLRSVVLNRDGKVILRIIPEKKKMRRLTSSIEYSAFGGFQLFNLISGAKNNNQLDFLDLTARFVDQGDSTIFKLIIDPHDYRRYLEKSRFSARMEVFYTSFEGINDLSFRYTPELSFSLLKHMTVGLFFSGGFHKNFDGLENQLIAEPGIVLSYGYRSPLNRTVIRADLELRTSVLHNYNRQRLSFDLIQDMSLGDFNLFGQWNGFSGETYPFNVSLIPFEKTAIINVEQMLSRDSTFISAEFSSRPLARLFRIGLLAQYFQADESDFGYGLSLYLNIKGFPIRLAGFIQNETFYLLVSLRMSL